MFCVRVLKVRARGADGSFMANYMPRGDAQFAAWAKHYVQAVSEYFQQQGLDDPMLLQLQLAYGGWVNRYAAHVAAQSAARAATENKDEARVALEDAVRPVTNFVQSYPATTDADRATIGISIRPPSGPPSSAPRTAPQAIIESPARLTHQLRLIDDSTPTRRARPRGVQRAEVFVALTPPSTPAPSDPNAYRYIGSVTRGETTLSFEPDKGGMQAHYLSRWVSTSGATGPWSETASATVAA